MIFERDRLDPPLPDYATLGSWALFLDLDGTLIDLAPTPDSVIVPKDLIETLAALQRLLGGALAIVSGRSLDVIDHLLRPLRLAAAGEHGAHLRITADAPPSERPDAAVPAPWRARIHDLAQTWPGALVEEKPHGIAVHFRANPALETEITAELGRVIAGNDAFEILPAVMAREIRSRAAHKGAAVRDFMQSPPFSGRRPIFIGDDITDEDAISAARDLGGVGLRVHDHFSGGPAEVRAWLRHLARRS